MTRRSITRIVPLPAIGVALHNRKQLAIQPCNTSPVVPTSTVSRATLMPFQKKLDHSIPTGCRLLPSDLSHPFRVALAKARRAKVVPTRSTALRIAKPKCATGFRGLSLLPKLALVLCMIPGPAKPRLAFITGQAVVVPALSVRLDSRAGTCDFSSDAPRNCSHARQRMSHDSNFRIDNLRLTTNGQITIATESSLGQLCFTSSSLISDRCDLATVGQVIVQSHVRLNQARPSFLGCALACRRRLQTEGLLISNGTRTFFSCTPAFMRINARFHRTLLSTLRRRSVPVAVACRPLSAIARISNPLILHPSSATPVNRQIFRTSLQSESA